MKKIWITLLIVILGGLAVFKLLDNKQTVEAKIYQPDPNQKMGVGVAVATSEAISQSNEFLGSFAPNRTVEVRPQIGGEIVNLPIREGQYIGNNQLIAKIDDDQLRFQKEALNITIEGHQNDLKRYEALVKGDATPAINIEKTELGIRSVQAQIKQIDKQLDLTEIKAPFGGIITAKNVEKGAIASPGMTLATITDISSLKLVLQIPEKAINNFKIGQKISVKTELYPGIDFPGTITLISAVGDAAHNYPIEITVPNPSATPLKAGMYGSISNTQELSQQGLVIPRQAIVGSTKNPQVFVVENEKAVLRDVKLGVTTSTSYEIVEGVKEGDKVVVSGQINLKNGTPVSIQ